jgi:hypothetical protein
LRNHPALLFVGMLEKKQFFRMDKGGEAAYAQRKTNMKIKLLRRISIESIGLIESIQRAMQTL